ncbi:MAG: RNA polymerase sigma factor [Verrucomicrobiales bacterium]|nr:RNA polymerase sigma factor [Verrucomicrobiales bacterium]MCP5560887.1 RNA polymerase sigma factor [Verrucomicrobiaceae bacterium]
METHLELLSRYHRHGDAAAFCALVKDHAGMVFATANRVTGDAALTEDVAQETFLELARSGHGAVRSVGAWLHRVAWRKACNAIRGESRRRRHELAAADVLHDSSDGTWDELEPLIDQALNELPAHFREPLVEHYLEGRTQQELASAMGVNQSTVSRLLDAALQELRSHLRGKGAVCGAGLATILQTHTAQAAPAPLMTSLGKLALSGAGTSLATTSTLIAMTATTKALLAIAAVAALSVPIALHRPPDCPPTVKAAPITAQPFVQEPRGTRTEPTPSPRRYRPAPVTGQVRQTVEAILRRHNGMTKQQLQRSPELNQLMNRFINVINTPEMQAKLEQRIAAIPPLQGSQQGTLRMDFDMLDDAHGRAWLEAAVSDDPQRIEDWILNTLDDAIFEFAFDPALERSSNGVGLQPGSPAKSETSADQDRDD